MVKETVEIKNKKGLHDHPAIIFVTKACEFHSSIWVEKDNRRVNAKSLLGILSLYVRMGDKIKIISDGSDEDDALKKLVELAGSKFDEPISAI